MSFSHRQLNGLTCALLLLVITISGMSSLPVGARRSASAVSDRRRNDGRALPVVISQYSNVRNSKIDTPATKDSLKAVESEITTTTSTTTTPSTTTTEATKETSSVSAKATVVQSEQNVEDPVVSESAAPASDAEQAAGEDSTLSPSSAGETPATDLPVQPSDPDTKSKLAPIQDDGEEEKAPAVTLSAAPEKEVSTPNRANEGLKSDDEKSANLDSEKGPEEQVKDEVAKEVQKDSEPVSDDSSEPVAPLPSPPAQPVEEQNLKLEQLFEEDRSFKNNFDDLSPLLDEKSVKESLVTPSSLFKELFQWDNDEESRTSEGDDAFPLADEKKSDTPSKKEKEKQLNKLAKETKPNKQSKLNDSQDPVDEYEDNLRKKRSAMEEDGAKVESDANTSVITLVPSNYPVVLANGESTLSDKITQEEEESTVEKSGDAQKETSVVVSLVPANYPVVLPDGTSTVSDKVKPEEEESTVEKSGNEQEETPVVFSLVPANYPVVLPDGTSTLSDKVKPEEEESTVEKSGNEQEETPIVISLVPANYPVVLPDGTSTLSDRIQRSAQEPGDTTAQENSAASVEIGEVPPNFPVVLPDGTQTLSTGSAAPFEIMAVPANFPIVLPDGTQTLSNQVPKNVQESGESNAPVEIVLVPSNFPVVLPNGKQTTSDKL